MKVIAGETLLTSTVKVVKQYFRQRFNILPQTTKNISLHICEQCVSSTNKHFATTGEIWLKSGSTGEIFGSRNKQCSATIHRNRPRIMFCLHGRMFCLSASMTFMDTSFPLRSSNSLIAFRCSALIQFNI